MLEIGAWLKANGASILGNRGGPWKPGKWDDSTRHGSTAYVHHFSRPAGPLTLPAIAGRRVAAAKMLVVGDPVAFAHTGGALSLTLPEKAIVNGDLVVELTCDGLPALAISSPGS